MTRREAARYLKVTIATVRRLELDGGLPTHRLTNAPNAPTRYYRSELDRWLRSRWTANNPGQQA
jgi:excisionase family DNA binding protein